MNAVADSQGSAKLKKNMNYFKRYWTLYLMLALPLIYFTVFKYFPIANILVAFKKYRITETVWNMEWADNYGFEFFIKAFGNMDFLYALRNTITLNLLDLLVGFPAPIILALLLNELIFKKFKRFTQTVIYMPHFLSWIIIYGLAVQLFAPNNGLVNNIIKGFGFSPIPFLNNPSHWIGTYIMTGVWQNAGWGTIIYLAGLTSINPELYEAASVDGAGRFRKIWHISLPGLRPTIVTLLIMSLGRILGSEFDRPFVFGNNLVKDVSNVLSVFVYTNGIRGMQFSLTAAVGLFQSIVSIIFLFIANGFAKKFGERGVW